MTESSHLYHIKVTQLFLFSIFFSFFIFFQSDALPSSFDLENVSWYVDYSNKIFHPDSSLKKAYFTESMLLPLIAKIVGANKSLHAYKLLCAAFQLMLIPLITLASLRRYHQLWKCYLLILTFGLSFALLKKIELGYPDPLTFILLTIATLSLNTQVIFISVVLSSLTHFTASSLSILGLVVCMLADESQPHRRRHVITLIYGVMFGKVFLWLWCICFGYTPSRIDWVIDHGIGFFITNYRNSVFWTIPGLPFLATFASILTYLFIKKKIRLFFSSIFCLGLAYLATFLSVDGIRIFSLVVFCCYLYLIFTVIQKINIKISEPHMFSKYS